MIGTLGRYLAGIGALLLLAGLIMMAASKVPWLGRLPGDIIVKREHVTLYVPLTTSVLISIVLSLIIFFFGRR